jgi:hypothetical protein
MDNLTKKTVAIAILIFLAFNGSAEQTFEPLIKDVRNYYWENDRAREALTQEESQDYAAIIIKDIQAHEYVYVENELTLYSLAHRIIRVNNDEGIRYFNRIYIPIGSVEEIITIKARSVGPDGNILNLDQDDFKEIKDEGENNNFKIFAIEGLEPGSEVEYFYISKENLSYFGRDLYQLIIPTKFIHFELIAPENLVFAAKGYNGFPELGEIIQDEKRIIGASFYDVPEIKDEEFCFVHANRMRVEYKLSHDKNQGDKPLLTWNDAAQHVYANMYQISKDDRKGVDRILKEVKLRGRDTEEERIQKIENYVKTTFIVQEVYQQQFYNLESVIANRYGNKSGIVKLFANLFARAGIQHELVLTSSRDVIRFDKDFESWNYLSDYLIYFPNTRKYLSPEKFEYRYGMVPYLNSHNYAMFMLPVKFGKYKTARSQIRFIPASNYTENFDNMDIEVSFIDNIAKADIDIKREMGGYTGVYIQPYFPFLQEDKKRLILEELVKLSAEDATFKELSIENGESNLSPLISPFTINADIESSSLIERAGTKFLFKLGKIIGPQTELYQDNLRRNDVENDFNRRYSRQITVNIPENYTIVNLDDIRMNVYFEKDGDKIFSFKSDYKIVGSQVVALVEEYYKEIQCPREYFEDFRKVINAAADFNKIALVFERKE